MKRIRTILILAIFLTGITILMCFIGNIKLENAINNILFGSTASVITEFVFEILNNIQEQKKVLNTFFWQGIVIYKEDLEELFLYSRDFYILEELFKDIQREDSDWNNYYSVYLENKKLLDPMIDGCIREIKNNGIKYQNHVAYLSNLLGNIDRKRLFFNRNNIYNKCYNLYNLVENINWTLCEAGKYVQNTNLIENSDEKKCRQLIICRWIADVYCVDYDRKIEDIDIKDNSIYEENNDIKAKKDFDKLVIEFINDI